MKSDRNNFMTQSMPFPGMGNMPMNMMMFPNYMNDSCSNVENRVSALEKKIKVLENRISRIENPYQNTNMQNFQNTNANMNNQSSKEESTCTTFGIIGLIASFFINILSLPFSIIAVVKGSKLKKQINK